MKAKLNLLILVFMISTLLFGQKGKYEKALKINTIEAYEEFLKKYPTGDYANQAKEKLSNLNENKDWDIASQKNTILSFENFLKQYPNSTYSNDAHSKLEKLYFEQTQTGNSIPDYNEFIERYPKGVFSDQVRGILEKLQEKEKQIFKETIEIQKKKYLSLVNSYPNLRSFEKEFTSSQMKVWWSKLINYSIELEQKGQPRLIIAIPPKNSFSIPIENVDSSPILKLTTETSVIVRDKGYGPIYSGKIQVDQSTLKPKIWDFLAEHTIEGKVNGWPNSHFIIESDPESHLKFYVQSGGVGYVSGRGILEVKDGPIILLGIKIEGTK